MLAHRQTLRRLQKINGVGRSKMGKSAKKNAKVNAKVSAKVNVIIVAAGKSRRMGFNKLTHILDDKPIILHAILPFLQIENLGYIVVATDSDTASHIAHLKGLYREDAPLALHVIEGGRERAETCYKALAHLKALYAGDKADICSSDIVLIHDGARPFVSLDIIKRCIDGAIKGGSAVASVAVTDTIREVAESQTKALDRSRLYAMQTPQAFNLQQILSAYECIFGGALANLGGADSGVASKASIETASIGATNIQIKSIYDDAQVYEAKFKKVNLVKGCYKNIKITTKEDLMTNNNATKNLSNSNNSSLIAHRSTLKTGIGYDVHKLVKGRKLIIGGVDIPFEMGLCGHSDADVLVHSVMDALLSAAGSKDIGFHFPDTDAKYKGADSIKLLGEVAKILQAEKYSVVNISCIIHAEKPKMLPHIDAMRANISKALQIDVSAVAISATTHEGLGFVGKGEGIAASASVLLSKEV